MMPPAGTQHRAEQFATLLRIAHEKFTDPEVGRLLDELRPLEDSLDPDSDDAALIRAHAARLREGGNVPARCARRWPAPRPRRARLGEGEGGVGLRVVPAGARANRRAEAPVRRLRRGWSGRALRRAPRRLRAADEDRRGAGAVRRAEAAARRADRGAARAGGGRLVPPRRLPARPPAHARVRGDRPLRPPARQLADRPDRASLRVGPGPRRRPDHDELPPGLAPLALLDDARVRPRPLQPPAARASRAAADRRAVLARDPRVAEPALGEPRRPQPPVLAALLPAPAGDVSRSSSAASTSSVPCARSHASSPA